MRGGESERWRRDWRKREIVSTFLILALKLNMHQNFIFWITKHFRTELRERDYERYGGR